jgi:hypothetical protein
MSGYNSQRRGTARTSKLVLNFFIVMYVLFSVFCVLFVCKCVLYCCHRVSTQLHLNIYHIISYHIISYHIISLSYHIISHHIIYHIIYKYYVPRMQTKYCRSCPHHREGRAGLDNVKCSECLPTTMIHFRSIFCAPARAMSQRQRTHARILWFSNINCQMTIVPLCRLVCLRWLLNKYLVCTVSTANTS